MRIGIRAGLVAGLLLPALAIAARADNPVAQDILKLHLSPQQLLSVRDFLGAFAHGIEIEASGGGAFVLRDDATMAYAGGFSLRVGDDGRVIVERVNGAAMIDATRIVAVPLRLDRKSQASVLAALADSQASAPPKPKEPADVAGVASVAPASIPPQGLPALRLMNAKAQGTVQESRAVFFRDGSGFVRSIRAPVIPPAASPSLNVTDRYFSPIQGDGTKLWRGTIMEIEADLPIGLADLESRYACTSGAECKPPRAHAPVSGVHVIRWSRQLVASVPPQLLAQISAPPVGTPPPADPAAAAQTPLPPAPASQTN
jgi:hypothetical protein